MFSSLNVFALSTNFWSAINSSITKKNCLSKSTTVGLTHSALQLI